MKAESQRAIRQATRRIGEEELEVVRADGVLGAEDGDGAAFAERQGVER